MVKLRDGIVFKMAIDGFIIEEFERTFIETDKRRKDYGKLIKINYMWHSNQFFERRVGEA